jgi:hypothetical protein
VVALVVAPVVALVATGADGGGAMTRMKTWTHSETQKSEKADIAELKTWMKATFADKKDLAIAMQSLDIKLLFGLTLVIGAVYATNKQ